MLNLHSNNIFIVYVDHRRYY